MVDGRVTTCAKNVSAHPSEWCYWYMINELGYTESSARAGVQGFSEASRALIDDSKWNEAERRVETPFPSEAGDAYLTRQSAAFEALGVTYEDMDFSGLIEGKALVDAADEEKEKLMRANALPEDGKKRAVGASGASARTDASGVSSKGSSKRSTGAFNIKENYLKSKIENSKQVAMIAALSAQMAKHGMSADLKKIMDEMGDASNQDSASLQDTVSDQPKGSADDESVEEDDYSQSDDSEDDSSHPSKDSDQSDSSSSGLPPKRSGGVHFRDADGVENMYDESKMGSEQPSRSDGSSAPSGAGGPQGKTRRK